MIEAFATLGTLALIFGAVFSLYLGLRRVIRPAPANAARATLAEMAEWLPTKAMSLREPNDHNDIVIGNEKTPASWGGNRNCNPDYQSIIDYNDGK